MHLYDVRGRAKAVLHDQPDGLLLEVAAMVLDAVGMVESIQETDFLQDILPFLQALLSVVRHLFDRHHLPFDIVPEMWIDKTTTFKCSS